MTSSKKVRFDDLQLSQPLLHALKEEGYEYPTPIQEQAIPHLLAQKDLLGVAQTGTGKTAAFALPMLQLLASRSPQSKAPRSVRALVLTPTRELAAQIGESFDRYGKQLNISNAVIFGGVGQNPQAAAIRRGVDILVATPGRLLDLIQQRLLDLSQIEIFVLDEADRMLDMGFIHDVRKTIKLLPQKRHSLFFSATMPPDIQRLAQDILKNPVKVEVTPIATTAEKIQQSVYFVEKSRKRELLEKLMEDSSISRALVFTRTKHGADKVARFLSQGGVPAEAIHGNKSQNNRVRALNHFKSGDIRILVATDIAARGIDIDGVTHVINYELPNVPESYVHRIGRTARAGAEGIAISFCDSEERSYLKDIERLIRMKIDVLEMDLGPEKARPRFESQARPQRHTQRPQRSDGLERPMQRAEGRHHSQRTPHRSPERFSGSSSVRSSDRSSERSSERPPFRRDSAPQSARQSSAPSRSDSSSSSSSRRDSSDSSGQARSPQGTRRPQGNRGARPQENQQRGSRFGGPRGSTSGRSAGPRFQNQQNRNSRSQNPNVPRNSQDQKSREAGRREGPNDRSSSQAKSQPWWKKLIPGSED